MPSGPVAGESCLGEYDLEGEAYSPRPCASSASMPATVASDSATARTVFNDDSCNAANSRDPNRHNHTPHATAANSANMMRPPVAPDNPDTAKAISADPSMPNCHPSWVMVTSFAPADGFRASRDSTEIDTGRSSPVPNPATVTPISSAQKFGAHAHSRNPAATISSTQLKTSVIPNRAHSQPASNDPAAIAKFNTALSAPT